MTASLRWQQWETLHYTTAAFIQDLDQKSTNTKVKWPNTNGEEKTCVKEEEELYKPNSKKHSTGVRTLGADEEKGE